MNKYKAIKINGVKKDEHRHKVEQKLGRKLSFNEVVHHKDRNKANNSDDNLEIIARADHSRLHMKGSKRKPETIEKLRIINRELRTNAKLSAIQVKEARQRLSEGMKQIEVARMFNVSKFVVSRLANGKAYHYL
jgi:DNA-binding transcriptional regulator YiaG